MTKHRRVPGPALKDDDGNVIIAEADRVTQCLTDQGPMVKITIRVPQSMIDEVNYIVATEGYAKRKCTAQDVWRAYGFWGFQQYKNLRRLPAVTY